MKRASQIIDELFSDLNVDAEADYISLFSQWEKISGTEIASHTRIKDVRGSTLIIESDHPAWSHMVTMNREGIIRKIRKAYPELGIDTLRVVPG